ncbi:hypothetical protein [Actinomadura sp. 3N508]|uniref:hypothetical protein n=1 Tax=Actinomadura sp. 3N508 TaxID=3375153 RepID=UPI00379447C5
MTDEGLQPEQREAKELVARRGLFNFPEMTDDEVVDLCEIVNTASYDSGKGGNLYGPLVNDLTDLAETVPDKAERVLSSLATHKNDYAREMGAWLAGTVAKYNYPLARDILLVLEFDEVMPEAAEAASMVTHRLATQLPAEQASDLKARRTHLKEQRGY